MPDEYGLAATEKAAAAHVGGLELDLSATEAVSGLCRAANATRKYLTNTVLRPHGLSWTGWVVLWVVWIFDGLESRHAAESAGISKGTLTGVVRTLEGRGWLRRRADENDRRLLHLELTDEGVAFVEMLFPEFNAAETHAVSQLDARTARAMKRGLRTMVTTVEEQGS